MPRTTAFALGADPEFILATQDGESLNADAFFAHSSAMGTDGHNYTAELRPYPAPNALSLVANMRAIMQEGIKENPALKNLVCLSGHYKHGEPIGGHIHINGIDESDHNDFNSCVEPMLIYLSDHIDELDERRSRRRGTYGHGCRTQTPTRVELRMPGSWLLSTSVAFLNIHLAEVVARRYLQMKEGLVSWAIFHRACRDAVRTVDKLRSVVASFTDDTTTRRLWNESFDDVLGATPLPWQDDFKPFGWA